MSLVITFQMYVGKIQKLWHGVDKYRKIEKEKITRQKKSVA